jgi:hypothetical protein
MNVNPTLSLKEKYGPKSQAWQEQQSPAIVRFWCDDDTCWGVPFHQITGTHYNAEHQSLLIDWSLGTIIVTGPKAWDFYDLFCNHRAMLLKADGKDILAVTMAINPGRDTDAPPARS